MFQVWFSQGLAAKGSPPASVGQDLPCNVRSNEVSQELDVREVLIFFSNGMDMQLRRAAMNGNLKKVKELLNRGANVNGLRDGFRPIHIAVVHGHLPVVKLLLNRGANVNARDMYGYQTIHRAATYDRLNIVKELLNRGANINARDRSGRTPIHYAAITRPRSLINVIKELINRGANVTNVLKSNDVSANTKNAIIEYYKQVRAKPHARNRAPFHVLAEHPLAPFNPNTIERRAKKYNMSFGQYLKTLGFTNILY